MTHTCVSNLIIIGSDTDLSPGRGQAIIRTNADMLQIGPLETNFSEVLISIHIFSFSKMYLKLSSGKYRPFLSRHPCFSNIQVLVQIMDWRRSGDKPLSESMLT